MDNKGAIVIRITSTAGGKSVTTQPIDRLTGGVPGVCKICVH